MPYDIKFNDEGRSDVKALPKNVRNSLKAALRQKLIRDPIGCSHKLEDRLREFRSFHWQKYRVVFKVVDSEDLLVIVSVEERLPQSRKDVYARLDLLASQGKLAERVLSFVNFRGFTRQSSTRCSRGRRAA